MHDRETRARARELYCAEGLSFAEVGRRTGVSERALKYWARAEGWRGRRERIAEDLAAIHSDTIQLRRRLIRKVLEGLERGVDPQQIYAVSALEGATAKLAALDPEAEPEAEPDEGAQAIKTPAEAALALEQAVRRRIHQFLTRPGTISLAGIREIKQAMELVEEMKGRIDRHDGKAQTAEGLSPELEARLLAALRGAA